MKNIVLILLGLFLLCIDLYSQDYEKVYFDSSDSSKYYYQVVPNIKAKGLLILLPGARGNSEWPLKTTKIPYVAADSGLVTIMINYEPWLVWLRDDVLNLLNNSIEHVLSNHNIPQDKCVIGGFSAGGTMALTYAEFARSDNPKTVINPNGVFAFDPPLDLIEHYYAYLRDVQGLGCFGEKISVDKISIIIEEKMRTQLGIPKTDYDIYKKYSPFLWTEKNLNGGQAEKLKEIPVRVYSMFDCDYFGHKIESCGMYPPTAPFLISFLRFKGNELATFKNLYDMDYKPDGGEKYRGRHAWKGFDSEECVTWIMKIINDE